MERFFGGNPALVLVRLAILSLIVGVVLAALGFSPFEHHRQPAAGSSSASTTWASPRSRRPPLLPARRRHRVPGVARHARVEDRWDAAGSEAWSIPARATARLRRILENSPDRLRAACRSRPCRRAPRSGARSGSGSPPSARSERRRLDRGPSGRARHSAARLGATSSRGFIPSFLRIALSSAAEGGVFRYSTIFGLTPRASSRLQRLRAISSNADCDRW